MVEPAIEAEYVNHILMFLVNHCDVWERDWVEAAENDELSFVSALLEVRFAVIFVVYCGHFRVNWLPVTTYCSPTE